MRIAFYTLGCKVNQYETAAIRRRLRQLGHEIVGLGEPAADGAPSDDALPVEPMAPADVYVVNTCTVTHLADRKSRQILRRFRQEAPNSIIVATGCYSEVDPEAVSQIGGVDLIVGNRGKERLADLIDHLARERGHGTSTEESAGDRAETCPEYGAAARAADRQNDTQAVGFTADRPKGGSEAETYPEYGTVALAEGRNRCFIKIEDGCDRFCAYCKIPYARGRVLSRDPGAILSETRSLLAGGYREVVLVGINAALYGQDRGETDALPRLIREIDCLPGDFRIRLGSLEPNVVDRDTAEQLAAIEKLCPHMHMALQSGSDRILKAMNRRYRTEDFFGVVDVLRRRDSGYGLTTDIIVGFPGETEDDFQQTLEAVERARFLKVHAFPFSPRSGTAAAELPGRIPPEIIRRRMARLAAISRKAAENYLEKERRKTRRLLVERIQPITGRVEGYTENYVRVAAAADGDKPLRSGEFYPVLLERPVSEYGGETAGDPPVMKGRVICNENP